MKVLMFGWEFPPHNSGGLGVACLGLTRALAGQGIQISFVLPKKVNVSSDFLKIIFADTPNVHIQEVDSPLSPYVTSESYREIRDGHAASIYGRTLFDEVRRYALLARHIAKKEPFDIIHAHDWLSFGAGMEAKRVSGKPLVVHVHATEFDRTGGNNVNQHVYDIERKGMETADAIIAVSNFTKNIITERYGINSAKVSVVHNGIDSFEYKNLPSELQMIKQDGTQIVLFVGRITLQKGPDYFIHTAKKVLHYYPKTLFVVVGSGDMQTQLMQEAAYLGISDKVLFTGFLRGDELNKLYQAADLCVFPSVSEPFGITALESLLNGTPVLVSKQSGVTEVISNALKVDFWDTDEMTNKIIAVLEYEPLKACLREYGGREVRKVDWGHSAKKCVDIYSNVLSNYHAPMTA